MMCSCQKCGKSMDEGQFYTYKDGSKTELCKKCLTLHIDNFDPNTFLWILQKMDVPYVPEEWNVLRDRAYAKDPKKMNGMSVFGKYLSKMKLKQWKEYGWDDSERLQAINAEKRAAQSEQAAELDAMYQEQYEAGQISEAQYRTLISTASQNERDIYGGYDYGGDPFLGNDNPYNENNFINETDLPDPAAQLTTDDHIFLAMKWGRLYKPSEWIELERLYTEMDNSFDIHDADTVNTLILLCKTTLKANQAIDSGDIDGFQKLSKVSESLRKTAKFTAAQKKEQEANFVDSIGELIRICERDGFIPRFATDIPQDKVDMTLRDMNEYVRKLVTQDLGFGQQIEDALRKIQIQKEMNEEAEKRQEEEGDEYDPYTSVSELADDDIANFYDHMEQQRQKDLSVYFGEESDK